MVIIMSLERKSDILSVVFWEHPLRAWNNRKTFIGKSRMYFVFFLFLYICIYPNVYYFSFLFLLMGSNCIRALPWASASNISLLRSPPVSLDHYAIVYSYRYQQRDISLLSHDLLIFAWTPDVHLIFAPIFSSF